ncbi:MAG: hypothetical protein PHV34_11590 [Verrucomicrobiae bacterium]|nr:hypothetical protein [Verrucomicrobiae bacterium]
MQLWFLRVADENISPEIIKGSNLAAVLFKQIPFSECRLGMDHKKIDELVEKYYQGESSGTKGQFKGSLHRFLTEAGEGDLVAVCVNGDQNLLWGELLRGQLTLLPGFEKENIKGRPVRWLSLHEQATIEKMSPPDAVRKYRGTICKWLDDVEWPDEEEEKRQHYYSTPPAEKQRQVKFIRVGIDTGCGGRLSRMFPGNYYHFIPIPKHNDPEFRRFTYGDVKGPTKFQSLLALRKGDLLVLYAGFDPERDFNQCRCVGIFSYFVIKEVFLFKKKGGCALQIAETSRTSDPVGVFNKLASRETFDEMRRVYGPYNPHVEEDRDEMQILICGDTSLSRLLSKVEVIAEADKTTGKYILSEDNAHKWGLKTGADLTRCSVRTVDSEHVDEAVKYLEKLP